MFNNQLTKMVLMVVSGLFCFMLTTTLEGVSSLGTTTNLPGTQPTLADATTPVVIPVTPGVNTTPGDRQAAQKQLREAEMLKEQKPPMGSKAPNVNSKM